MLKSSAKLHQYLRNNKRAKVSTVVVSEGCKGLASPRSNDFLEEYNVEVLSDGQDKGRNEIIKEQHGVMKMNEKLF